MKRDQLGSTFTGAGALAIGFFFVVRWLFDTFCFNQRWPGTLVVPGMSDSFDMTSTAALFAVSIFFLFAATILTISKGGQSPDRAEKLTVLAMLGWCVVWLGYVSFDGSWCSKAEWRSNGVVLLVPLALGALGLFGRRWLNHDN